MQLTGGRHITVVTAAGRVLGACDCSARHNGQVLIAEAPATGLDGAAIDHATAHPLIDAIASGGHAFQAAILAESAGRVIHLTCPGDARTEPGDDVAPGDLLVTVLVHASDRRGALRKLAAALDSCRIFGVATNLELLRQAARHPAWTLGAVTTDFLPRLAVRRRALTVLAPGLQTTVQDYPGRLGYWHVGVPPSGPMDPLAFRLANRLVDNPAAAAALEIAVNGPTLRFEADIVFALTGADFAATLDGAPVERWQAVSARAGSVLQLRSAAADGLRAYLAVAGGIEAPEYLGSRATFILGKFGGAHGRALRPGDVLHLGTAAPNAERKLADPPAYSRTWEIGVLYGPHGAPDFFTPGDIATFFSTHWKVHHNSDRTGVRLIGPKPEWARPDGGEAGLHPSNIHDNAYAVGTIDFTGDMPVILGPDGPSLGGFVCPATIVHAELWKLGQLRPGDLVRFRAISHHDAGALDRQLERYIETLAGVPPALPEEGPEDPILRTAPGVVCRADGDRYLLVEYGPNVLDLNLRFRVQALMHQLESAALPGILDITPGVRSLHIHFDGRRLTRPALLEALAACEARIPDLDDIAVPSRVVHLPLSWDDPATQLAIRRYTQSVRPDAPWCPSNLEFIRRINGLASIDDVRRIVYSAEYLVLGLGDVYLGAPVATPLDPRHRLVTTKYNPARTWTPENAVGIGGAYLCVYGMEGPGGYQFVGRTLQMWNTFRATPEFQPGTPWLLRFFDRIRFNPVSAAELLEIRKAFPHGRYPLRIEEEEFRLRDYHRFLAGIQPSAAAFKARQQAAFVEERERWAAPARQEVAV
jgi:urea carboxylase